MTEAAAQIIGLYRRHAQAWARDRGTRLREAAWLERFLALIPAGGSVLDLGCGSGEPIARKCVACGYRVTGVDAAPEMIEMCRRRFQDHEWLVADMRRLALARRFDGVLAWDSFFHLCPDDQHGMFPIFRRHASAGAPLMFTSGTSHGERIGSYAGEQLYHASLDSAAYRALLDANGFEVIDHVVEDPVCDRTVWLTRTKEGVVF